MTTRHAPSCDINVTPLIDVMLVHRGLDAGLPSPHDGYAV